MTRPRPAVAILIVLLVVAGALALGFALVDAEASDASPIAAAPDRRAVAASDAAGGPERVAVPAAGERRPEQRPEIPSAPASARPTVPPRPQQIEPVETVQLDGSLDLLGDEGLPLPPGSGSFVLEVYSYAWTGTHSITLKDGLWSARVPRDSSVRPDQIRIENTTALPESGSTWHPVGAGRFLALLARPALDVRLDVVASDEREVRHIVVSENAREPEGGSGGRGWMWLFEGRSNYPGTRSTLDVVASADESPVNLPPPVRLSSHEWDSTWRTYWVRAEGYAWVSLDVDHARPRGQSVELRPGGELVLELAGHDPTSGQQLKVVRQGEPLTRMSLGRADVVRLDGLETGHYTVEVLARWPQNLQLAYMSFDIRKGERTELRMHVAEEPFMARSTPLGGRLVVPAAWGQSAVSLEAKLLERYGTGGDFVHDFAGEALEPVDGVEGAWSFLREDVPPGAYLLTVKPLGYFERVSIEGALGNPALRVEVPAPVIVSVTVRSADGALAPIRALRWQARFHSMHGPGWMPLKKTAERDAETGKFVFAVPAGEIEVSVPGQPFPRTVRADPRQPEIEIRLAD